jgi:hypothetical protein
LLHPVWTSHLQHVPKHLRLEVLTQRAQAVLQPAQHQQAPSPPASTNTVRHAADVRQVEAKPLPRLSDAEQWAAVKPQIQLGSNLNLSEEEKKQLMKALAKHPHAFSKDQGDLGLVRGVYHRIDMGNHAPIKRGGRPLSPFEREEIDRQMAPMEKWNVIRPSTSPFAAPVVLARKKGGKWRFCVDYRPVNAVMVPNCYPLPRMESIFAKLEPAKYFTTLDAQSGYWQIPMHPDDVHKTAFLTHRGLFEFLQIPFGLTGAPGTYQLVMDDLVKEETRCSLRFCLECIWRFSTPS